MVACGMVVVVVATIDDLLAGDSDTATRIAVSVVPGFVAEMDELAAAVTVDSSKTVLLSYSAAVDGAAQRLTTLPAKDPDTAERAATGYFLLRYNSGELLWTAPTVDGTGVLTALVDRFRVLVGGLAHPPRRGSSSLDRAVFGRVVEMLAEIEFERRVDEPLKRAMATLALTSGDVAKAMGVTRQAVDKWLRSGIPSERLDRVGALAEIADILRHRLRVGMPAVVARRPADAYAGRSMLEMITDGEHPRAVGVSAGELRLHARRVTCTASPSAGPTTASRIHTETTPSTLATPQSPDSAGTRAASLVCTSTMTSPPRATTSSTDLRGSLMDPKI